jgi:hypothetical protein
MDIFREKYENIKGKTNSMYMYILYECSQDSIKEHVKKQLEIVDRVGDSFKRKTFSARYFSLRNFIDQNKEDHIYNCILFIDDNVNEYKLTNENKKILKKYNHQSISYVYDDHFDLDYLEDLIFNDEPYHMFHVNNNKIDYLYLTKTKKIIINTKESKPLDIMDFINLHLPINSKYIIYGVSSKLKDIIDPRAYSVLNKHVKDDELISMITRIDQEDVLIELTKDLSMISESKSMHKIVFKNELTSKIKNSQLQKLYIDNKFVDKFLENIKKNNIDVNFKIIIIDTLIKSFIDGQERLLEQYGGVVGVTYY